MARIEKYKDIILDEMEYRAGATSVNANIKRHLVVNPDRTDFVVLSFGWKGKSFRHNVVFHIQIVEEKVWIYQNNTDVDLVEIFMRNGILRSDMVLGFLSEFERSLWEYETV